MVVHTTTRLEQLFDVDTHTHTDRQTNALKTIPAFTMAARRLVTTARLAN